MDDDLAVLAEYQRIWLVKQDSECVATSIEQVALNIQCRNKLKNLLLRLKVELRESKVGAAILATTMESVSANSDANIFFIDQMARAYLLYCKMAENDHIVKLSHLIDVSMFDPTLTFPKDTVLEISSSYSPSTPS